MKKRKGHPNFPQIRLTANTDQVLTAGQALDQEYDTQGLI